MADEPVQQTGQNESMKTELWHSDNLVRSGHQYVATSLDGSASAHFGDVYHSHNYTQAVRGQTQALVRPTRVLPFHQDPDFVERDVLRKILHRTSEPAARIGLVGLGGVGKTQIAIECVYRRRAADPNLWVFWVHASSIARFEESYRQIAQQLRIGDLADPKADVLALVCAWLSDETNGDWTMVVDNADDSEVMFGSLTSSSTSSTTTTSHDRSLSDYLPSSVSGSILITSRSRDVVMGVIDHVDDVLHVAPMTEEEAIALIAKKLKLSERHPERDKLSLLVQELDYMPLAITQAASYINQLGSRMPVSRYLELLANNDAERERLLHKDLRDPRRGGRASNSIIITWHTSFEHIRQAQSSAARLLALMSFFDREAIPESLLQGQYSSQEVDRPGSWQSLDNPRDDGNFDEDIALLDAYSLINAGANEQLFSMHRLVQFSTRKWLELHGELTSWLRRYIEILDAAYPTGDYDNWPTCRALFPHVEAALSYKLESPDTLQTRGYLFYKGAWFADANGRYEMAVKMAAVSLEDRERSLGPDHTQTLESASFLAITLMNQGKYSEAEKLFRRTLEGTEKKRGGFHPDTLTDVSLLGRVLQNQGEYSEAEKLLRRALEGREIVFGTSHPNTLTSVNNLAVVLQDQKQYGEAEKLFQQALAGTEEQLGKTHPETLTGAQNLAAVLWQQGKNEQAEELSQQTMDTREMVLGLNHPDTLTSMSFLGLVLDDLGQYERAERLTRQALQGRERVLGANHPDTLSSVNNLASLLQDTHKFEEALSLYDRAVTGYTKTLGSTHPTTLIYENNRRLLLQEMNRL